MENQDKILDVLNNFEKTPSRDIPPVLEDYLRTVAKTGKTVFPWQQLKLLFVQKLEQVMEQFNKDDPCDRQTPFPNVDNTKFIEMRQRIIDALQKFNGAPFTVQRICELVTQPKKHYTQCDKFLRGIEKNVMVVSTVDPNGRKIVSESAHPMVNGLDMNGVNQQRSDFNDFTDGQPFGPGPLVDWSGQVATVWPEPINADNKNNSSAERDLASSVDRVNNLKSDEKLEDSIDSGLSKVAPVAAAGDSEDQFIVKDCVVKDSAPSPVLSNTLSNQSENKAEETENKIETPDISNSESSDDSKQSLDNTSSGDSDSHSKLSFVEKSADVGVSSEKHAMDTDDGATAEPPEKKLKVDHSDEHSTAQETKGPASEESQVQDSNKDSSQGQKVSTCEQTETQDTKLERCQEEDSKSEKSSDDSAQQQSERSLDRSDNETKAMTEDSTTEQVQPENSEQVAEESLSTEHTDNVSKTNSDSSESANSGQEVKINNLPEKENADGGEEQKGSNSGAEMMDTESGVENKGPEAGKPTKASEEGEPMEQE